MMIVIPPMSTMKFTPPACDREALEEDRVEARAEVDAGDDHRRGVDERGDGSGTGHGVGEPGMERELTALADDPDEEADRAGEQERVVGAFAQRVFVRAGDVERARGEEHDDDADHQADVAGAGGEERLQRRGGVLALLPEVPDQRERAEADAFPAHEHHERVVGDDEQQHRRGEQAEHRVVVREADLFAHVRDRVDVHEQRDQR